MGIRSRKPTSPGRRFQTVGRLLRDHQVPPREVAARSQAEEGWPRRRRPHDVPPPRRWAQAALPRDRLQAGQGRCAGQGRRHRVRPEPHVPHRPAPLRRRREGVHPGAQGPQRRRPRPERQWLRHQAGQRHAAALHPRRHGRPQRRAAARPGRQDRPVGRHRRAARRQGRRLRHAAHAVDRDAPRADRLPGDGRRGRQQRARARSRSARPAATAGRASSPRPVASP